MLNDAGMGFADVLLEDAVIRDMVPAYIEATKQATTLLLNREEAIARWEDLGFRDLEDFIDLKNSNKYPPTSAAKR